jgi:hypothetical protein
MIEKRPNFFLLLGIDPDDAWKEDHFRRVLQEKQEAWRRQSAGVSRPAQEAKRNLGLLEEIEAVMLHSARREQEARAARALAKAPSLPNPPGQGDASAQRERELLARIQRLLLEVNLPDLYALFKLPASSSLAVLQRSVKRFQNQLAASASTERPEQLLRELVNCAEDIFHTEASRRFYDESLRRGGEARSEPEQEGEIAGPLDARAPIEKEPPQQHEPSKRMFSEQKKEQPFSIKGQFLAEEEKLSTSAPIASAYSDATDIAELVLKNLDGAFSLKWVWPATCTEALLLYSHADWPQPGRPGVIQLRITRSEYETRGHYELSGPLDLPYWIVVSAVLRKAEGPVITAGARVQGYMARKLFVDYEIKNARFGARRRTLHLYTRVPGRLPTLLLRSNIGHPPLTKEEGVLLQRIEGPLEVYGECVIPLPAEPRPNTFGALFLEDDRLYSVITLYRPPERKLSFGR